jgi:DNA-directed DNA polymerase III PolC
LTDEEFLVEISAIVDTNPSSRVLNAKKSAIAKNNDLRTVKTSDNAFIDPEDVAVFELVSRAGLKPTPQYILADLGSTEQEQALADACKGLFLPKALMVRAEGDLEQICREGIVRRGMQDTWTDEYETRMLYELELIRSKDFESYFLIVADMCAYAKANMLVGPSRGSAAGSLVCYLSYITEINPIPPKLYFERFIDVTRTDLPDIDLDFPDNKRHLVFEYMAKKHGDQNTAHIGTISQFKPKSALIQVCKSLNIPPAATAAVKIAMIERSSADSRANNCLEDTFKETDPGRKFIEQYPQAVVAQKIEGHASHTGVHAAGLLVSNAPITDFCVVDADGIAHVEKGAAEKLGLLKIDVLGLRTLGVLEDSGVPIDWYALPFDDPATYEIFNSGRLCGIFQFEGNALRAISRDVDFRSLTEIDAVTALARPGPFGGGVTEEWLKRKNGKVYEAIHPLVEAHMAETYGLPVYQEQTLAIVREIGKFDWKETSTIRKAMSKRMGKEFFDTYWEKFKVGAMSQGISEESARSTWNTINSMGAWQMNKAHTYSYAVISYMTAYLKAHHPLEFAASNLRNAKDEDSAIELLREMVKEGLQYVPFDIELSEANWSAKDGKLVGGFMNLKGVGESKAAKLIEARNAGKLTPKQRADTAKAENTFGDLFPFKTHYGKLYENPGSKGINGDIEKIETFDGKQRGSFVFLGELIYKNARNANEEVNVKKRGGKKETGPLDFVDVRLRDDTGMIGGRVGRHDFEAIGRELLETVPEGAHLLVRAKFIKDIRYAFITKWRWLNKPQEKSA